MYGRYRLSRRKQLVEEHFDSAGDCSSVAKAFVSIMAAAVGMAYRGAKALA